MSDMIFCVLDNSYNFLSFCRFSTVFGGGGEEGKELVDFSFPLCGTLRIQVCKRLSFNIRRAKITF